MQNDVLKHLGDNELVRRAFLASKRLRQAEDHSYAALLEQSVEELERRLSALRGEVERLKSELSKRPTEGEAVVMRELCEAFIAYEIAPSGASSWQESMDRLIASRDAYRAMKGEQNAMD